MTTTKIIIMTTRITTNKNLLSKCTRPIKIKMHKILAIILLYTFFNIKPKWYQRFSCASLVVFPFKEMLSRQILSRL